MAGFARGVDAHRHPPHRLVAVAAHPGGARPDVHDRESELAGERTRVIEGRFGRFTASEFEMGPSEQHREHPDHPDP
ncbi:MAG: hypothetical protein R2715_22850 [Ilumatobacteraceae bacterium]